MLRISLITLTLLASNSCTDDSQDYFAETVSGSKLLEVSCTKFETSFSLTIIGCGDEKIKQSNDISFTYEGPEIREPILEVKVSKDIHKNEVIRISSESFEVDLPTRWCGKSNDRLTKLDPRNGFELVETVKLTEKKRRASHGGWDFCSFETIKRNAAQD